MLPFTAPMSSGTVAWNVSSAGTIKIYFFPFIIILILAEMVEKITSGNESALKKA